MTTDLSAFCKLDNVNELNKEHLAMKYFIHLLFYIFFKNTENNKTMPDLPLSTIAHRLRLFYTHFVSSPELKEWKKCQMSYKYPTNLLY